MQKITKSFRVNPELWTEMKIHIAKTGDNLSSFIEQAIKEKLKKK